MIKTRIFIAGILYSLLGNYAFAKSLDLQSLQANYPARHFEEIKLPSGTTHYQSNGSGPVIILVHGVSGPLSVWDKTVDPLVKAGFRVIRYDLYGRGFSSRLESAPYSLETYVAQLEELIAALKLSAPIRLVGSSLGAIISTEYALRHSQEIVSLVLIGPAGFPITVPFTAKLKDIPLLGGIFTYFLAYSTILTQNDHYFVSQKVPQEIRPFIADQLLVPGSTDAILKTMQNSPVQRYVDSYRALGRTKIQVGLIWGRQDATFPFENSRILLEAAPQTKLIAVENSGHLPQYESAEIVNPIIVQLENSFR